MKKKIFLCLVLVLVLALLLISCAKKETVTQVESKTEELKYVVVIQYSGGQVVDVHKTTGGGVLGWDTRVTIGAPLAGTQPGTEFLYGDVRVTHCKDKAEFDRYVEYHKALDLLPYEEFMKRLGN